MTNNHTIQQYILKYMVKVPDIHLRRHYLPSSRKERSLIPFLPGTNLEIFTASLANLTSFRTAHDEYRKSDFYF